MLKETMISSHQTGRVGDTRVIPGFYGTVGINRRNPAEGEVRSQLCDSSLSVGHQ